MIRLRQSLHMIILSVKGCKVVYNSMVMIPMILKAAQKKIEHKLIKILFGEWDEVFTCFIFYSFSNCFKTEIIACIKSELFLKYLRSPRLREMLNPDSPCSANQLDFPKRLLVPGTGPSILQSLLLNPKHLPKWRAKLLSPFHG